MTVQLKRSMGWTLTAAVKLALVSKDLRRVLAIVVHPSNCACDN